MDRRKFVKTVALVPLAAGAGALSFEALQQTGFADSPAATASQGPLHDRYELTLHRVLHGESPAYTEEFVLADVRPTPERRFAEYSGDVSGRYIGALATAARVYGASFPGLDALVAKTIALEKPDGYFGSGFHYDKPGDLDLALLWGNGRLLVGLLEYYRLKPAPPVLAACRRLGDWLVRIGPLMLSKEIRAEFGAQHFASSYICWMQQTEGLANLYMVTKDERYRKLAAEIAAVIERRPSDHVHGYLTSLRGVMDLYAATGDAALLRQCEAAWTDVTASQDLLITGGVPEGWSPNGHRTEGCAECDWVRLNLALWKATGERKYIAMAERAIFNELAFNQFATGDFGHRLYSDTGLPGNGAVRAWWCCTLHGLRAFPDIHENVFTAEKNGLRLDLPLDGRIETPSLTAASKSTLATDGSVRITIEAAGRERATVNVRRPEWASTLAIRLNGAAYDAAAGDGLLRIERNWTAGDVIELKYAMQLKQEPAGSDRVAYWYGPWLLGAPASTNPAYFNELTEQNRLVHGKEAPIPAANRTAHAFAIPIAATTVPFIHAEYADQPQTVTLRAIAEQSGQPTTAWELRFLAADKS